MRWSLFLHAWVLVANSMAQAPEARHSTPPDVAIGTKVEASFQDLRWGSRRVADLPRGPATVIYFATVECPIVLRTLPRVGALARAFAPRGVVTIVMNVGVGDAFVEAAAQACEHAPDALFGKDQDLSFARACGVGRTNAVVVLDHEGTLRYRGMIDDQDGYRTSRDQPSQQFVGKALDELLSGKAVTVSEVPIQGCKLTDRPPLDPQSVPTYMRDVAPILARACLHCHMGDTPGAIAIAREVDVRKHASMIAEVVENGRMPPWTAGPSPLPFVNRRGLTLAERETIRAWVAGGMPRGEPQAHGVHPSNRTWRVGEVTMTIDASEEIRVPSGGALPYQYIVLPHRFKADTWVEALDIRSQVPGVLKHCNLAIVPNGEAYSPSSWTTNYTAHGVAFGCVPGSALRIPAGSGIVLQAYYVPIGRAVNDRLQVGLRFPRVPVTREVRVTTFGSDSFSIPAGTMSHAVAASWMVPTDAVGISLFVHMGKRGRDIVIQEEHASGDRNNVLVVPSYDFGGQEIYLWPRGAPLFASGTKLHALAHFDNSSWNPLNPDPRVVVSGGLAPTDERMQVSCTWVPREESPGIAVDWLTGVRVVPDAPLQTRK